jgi:hypothetical protein
MVFSEGWWGKVLIHDSRESCLVSSSPPLPHLLFSLNPPNILLPSHHHHHHPSFNLKLEKLSFRLLFYTILFLLRINSLTHSIIFFCYSLAIVRYLISHPFDLVINLLCYFLKSFVSLFHFQVSYFVSLLASLFCCFSPALKPIECGGAFMVISSGTQKLNSNWRRWIELSWVCREWRKE